MPKSQQLEGSGKRRALTPRLGAGLLAACWHTSDDGSGNDCTACDDASKVSVRPLANEEIEIDAAAAFAHMHECTSPPNGDSNTVVAPSFRWSVFVQLQLHLVTLSHAYAMYFKT